MNNNVIKNILCVIGGLILACGLIYFIHELVLFEFAKDAKKTIIYLEVIAFILLMSTYLLGEIAHIIKWVMNGGNIGQLSLNWRQIILVMSVLLASVLIIVASITYLRKI